MLEAARRAAQSGQLLSIKEQAEVAQAVLNPPAPKAAAAEAGEASPRAAAVQAPQLFGGLFGAQVQAPEQAPKAPAPAAAAVAPKAAVAAAAAPAAAPAAAKPLFAGLFGKSVDAVAVEEEEEEEEEAPAPVPAPKAPAVRAPVAAKAPVAKVVATPVVAAAAAAAPVAAPAAPVPAPAPVAAVKVAAPSPISFFDSLFGGSNDTVQVEEGSKAPKVPQAQEVGGAGCRHWAGPGVVWVGNPRDGELRKATCRMLRRGVGYRGRSGATQGGGRRGDEGGWAPGEATAVSTQCVCMHTWQTCGQEGLPLGGGSCHSVHLTAFAHCLPITHIQ